MFADGMALIHIFYVGGLFLLVEISATIIPFLENAVPWGIQVLLPTVFASLIAVSGRACIAIHHHWQQQHST
jgi:hypothetical protein